jgi:mRNA interferase RelE/StbE
VSLRVDYDERAIDQAAAFLDDPPGIREVLDAIDRLADDPRPPGSFPYGSPDLRRLRVGRYRILVRDHRGHGRDPAYRPRHRKLTPMKAPDCPSRSVGSGAIRAGVI